MSGLVSAGTGKNHHVV